MDINISKHFKVSEGERILFLNTLTSINSDMKKVPTKTILDEAFINIKNLSYILYRNITISMLMEFIDRLKIICKDSESLFYIIISYFERTLTSIMNDVYYRLIKNDINFFRFVFEYEQTEGEKITELELIIKYHDTKQRN